MNPTDPLFPKDSPAYRPADEAEPKRGPAAGPENRADSELLDAVLRETVGKMSDQEAHRLISAWISEQPIGQEIGYESVLSLVRYLLGQRFNKLTFPESQVASIARWLWEDPAAKARLERLWREAGRR